MIRLSRSMIQGLDDPAPDPQAVRNALHNAVKLEHADIIPRQFEGRKAPHQPGRCEHFVTQVMEVSAGERPLHEGALRRPDLHDSGDVEKLKPAR